MNEWNKEREERRKECKKEGRRVVIILYFPREGSNSKAKPEAEKAQPHKKIYLIPQRKEMIRILRKS